ncbi:MAG: ABC transporter ATP-binding protein [Candidatus Omnitrophota bacterium]
MLVAKNIHKIYRNPVSKANDVHVLKGVSLSVEMGEIVAIVGPSGAGKSTLLHILGGLDQPSHGEVFLRDQNLYAFNDIKRAKIRNEKVGFIFQFYHLLPEFNALENVVLPAMIKSRSRMTAQMRMVGMDFLKKVGLSERVQHKPNELSGGEQQRVAIARAIINQPDILFCDEPTGNLDSETGQGVIDLLMKLNAVNKQTLVMVTHDEKIAQRANRVIYLKDGEVAA